MNGSILASYLKHGELPGLGRVKNTNSMTCETNIMKSNIVITDLVYYH
jgi:hypothetical protein